MPSSQRNHEPLTRINPRCLFPRDVPDKHPVILEMCGATPRPCLFRGGGDQEFLAGDTNTLAAMAIDLGGVRLEPGHVPVEAFALGPRFGQLGGVGNHFYGEGIRSGVHELVSRGCSDVDHVWIIAALVKGVNARHLSRDEEETMLDRFRGCLLGLAEVTDQQVE